ncbi:DUF7289 family protein [Natronococcus wangiae]|uniref:DUF7289 family protein n=1 Tax=Natronococcus wangiae TaxID=3068275 RepID=UPI00273FFCC6|nr:hypothetical protein [Natronococcus sp. AD5]
MRRNRTPGTRDEDRAVSEVLSFVLAFGIILTSVAVLSMTGFQAMDDYRESEQLRNGERAMEALADNFNDVLRYDAIEKRHGELSLREGTVTTGNEGTNITVEFNESGNEVEKTYDLGTFNYEYDSETIAYEGGAVVRAGETGGSVVLGDPLLTCRDDTAIVSLVRVDADDRSIQSNDGVGFTAHVEERNSTTYDVDDGSKVSITVDDGETPYEGAWDTVEDDWNGCEPNRVQITVVTVDIDY